MDYGCIVWHECNKSLLDKLERLQNQAMRVILRAKTDTRTQYMRNTPELLRLYNRRRFLRFVSIFTIVSNQNCPKQLTSRAELQTEICETKALSTSSERKTFKLLVQVTGTHSLQNLAKNTSIGCFKFKLFKQLRDSIISNHDCAM